MCLVSKNVYLCIEFFFSSAMPSVTSSSCCSRIARCRSMDIGIFSNPNIYSILYELKRVHAIRAIYISDLKIVTIALYF